MKILAFGFRENSSGEIIKQLDERVHKTTIESKAHAIDSFVACTNFENYDYVIGVGSYSGIDKDKIRIESVCTSQFRNNKTNLVRIKMQPFFQSSDKFKLTYHMGNSYCSLVSYRIATKYPNQRFTFLHIPRNFLVETAVIEINKQISRLQI